MTAMYVVRPELLHGEPVRSVIPLTSRARACHLMPVLLDVYLPIDYHFSRTLDDFGMYYVNAYIDYHAHETIM